MTAVIAEEDKKLRELVDAKNLSEGMIHSVKKTMADNPDKVEKEEEIDELILEGIWKKVEDYIDIYKAKKYVICADGVAPTAKIIQQRKKSYTKCFT